GNALSVVDISDPTAMTEVGRVVNGTTLREAHTIQVSDGYAYLAANDGYAIVDITDPTNPVIVWGQATVSGDLAHGISLSGNYLYGVTVDVSRIFAVDITDPTNPNMVIEQNLGTGLVDIYA